MLEIVDKETEYKKKLEALNNEYDLKTFIHISRVSDDSSNMLFAARAKNEEDFLCMVYMIIERHVKETLI